MLDGTGIVQPGERPAGASENLNQALQSLVGLPFLFFHPSYGDELKAHFGAADDADHPNPKGMLGSSHAMYTRASNWKVVDAHGRETSSGSPLPSLEAESRISGVEAIATPAGYCLEVRLDDGSLFAIVPDPDPDLEPGAPTPIRDDCVADWEVFMPEGCLWAGPGLQWAFEAGRI